MNDAKELKFEIVEQIGEISESTKGWKKELNLVKWNDRDAKFDIRDWDSEHSRMGKGVTLSKDELIKLRELLNSLNL